MRNRATRPRTTRTHSRVTRQRTRRMPSRRARRTRASTTSRRTRTRTITRSRRSRPATNRPSAGCTITRAARRTASAHFFARDGCVAHALRQCKNAASQAWRARVRHHRRLSIHERRQRFGRRGHLINRRRFT